MSEDKSIFVCFKKNKNDVFSHVQTSHIQEQRETFQEDSKARYKFVRPFGEKEEEKLESSDPHKSDPIAGICYEVMQIVDKKLYSYHHLI